MYSVFILLFFALQPTVRQEHIFIRSGARNALALVKLLLKFCRSKCMHSAFLPRTQVSANGATGNVFIRSGVTCTSPDIEMTLKRYIM